MELATERWPQSCRGRVSDPAQAALSGSQRKAPSFAGGYLHARIKAFDALRKKCENVVEDGWLEYGIRKAKEALEEK